MAGFTITIENRMKLYSPGTTSLWGSMVWGVDVWGSDRDADFFIGKQIDETLDLDSVQLKDVLKLIENQVTIDSNILKSISKTAFTNSVTLASDPSIIYLRDLAGYLLYSLGQTDLEERRVAEYSSDADAMTSFTTATGSNTEWS